MSEKSARIYWTVKAIDLGNRYGFIGADDGREYKITRVGLEQTPSPETVLRKGSKVSFVPLEKDYGSRCSLFADFIEPAA